MKAKTYKHLFFDLDRTLWDFETNSQLAFKEIYKNRDLERIFPSFDAFLKQYKVHNTYLWNAYKRGTITKNQLKQDRFSLTLQDFDCNDVTLAMQMSDDYIELSPQQTNLFPGTIETLTYLQNKYRMHIITNGFKEVQFKKLKNSGLDTFFEKVVTSEEARAAKPKPEIFHTAISSVNAKKIESIMIGDDLENDILGAKKFGLDQVYFNPEKVKHDQKISYEIREIPELISFL